MNFFFVANGRSTATRGNGRQGQNRFAVRYRTANRRRSGQSGALVQERWQPVHLHVSTFLQQQQQCVNVSAISCASFNFTVPPPHPLAERMGHTESRGTRNLNDGFLLCGHLNSWRLMGILFKSHRGDLVICWIKIKRKMAF